MDKTRKRVGRDAATTLAERQQIGLLKATGLSNREIARQTGRARQTVATVLKSPDVESLRARAREVLDTGLPEFAADLITASREGSKRGRHEPALDALLCMGVLEKPQTAAASGITINIGIAPGQPVLSMSDIQILPDPHRRPQRQAPNPGAETES